MLQERFTYASEPHAAPLSRNKTKYRESPQDGVDASGSFNMMNDPRVVRGNTYSAKSSTPVFEPDLPAPPSAGQDKGKTLPQKSARSRLTNGTRTKIPGSRSRGPSAQPIILEELTDRLIEVDIDTQAQVIAERPISPIFVTSKTGQDVGTQIDSGDLFDFDLEVEPLLEVLVGRTIHVSVLELIQQEEFETMRRAQIEFELVRNLELAELQRMQAERRRKTQEKERRQSQEQQRRAERVQIDQKVTAQELSRNYLSAVHDTVLETLQEEGCFYDPIKQEIEESILGSLLTGMRGRVDHHTAAREMLEELIMQAWDKAVEFQERGEAAREAKKERERKEAELLAKRKAEEEAKRVAEEAARRAAEEAAEEAGGAEDEA
jgi:radial spoke head protein 3